MVKTVSVFLHPTDRRYTFSSGDFELHPGDMVVVETEKGQELARVASHPQEMEQPAKTQGGQNGQDIIRPILRKAAPEDIAKLHDLAMRETEALATARQEAHKLQLPMKFVGAHYTLDGGQVILFFFAEDRVDFRQLLRQINDVLKVRVELRQIGTRDGAKITGGVGRCGRTLCCTMWLTSFSPVTIRMAKDQNLPISADGLSGQCGRLRCCLRYECEQYQALSKRLPRTNEIVVTPQGEGRVVDVHPIKETVTVAFGEGDARVLPLESITRKERPVNNTQQSQTQPAVQEEEPPDTIES